MPARRVTPSGLTAGRHALAVTLSCLLTVGAAACSGTSAVTANAPMASGASVAGGASASGSGDAGGAGTPSAGATTPSGLATWRTEPVSVGRRFVTEYKGPASGVTMRVRVWLPPQYAAGAASGERFPVVVMFPGGSGVSGAVWLNGGQPELVNQGAKSGTITPFVLVEPQMQISDSLDTECADLSGQPKVGTFLDTDLPDLLKASLRVLPQRTAWATTGVSSGAYCSVRVAMARPDTFAFAAPLDGYFVIDSNLTTGSTAAAKATSPIALAANTPAPDVRIHAWYGTGKGNDQLSKARSRKFAATVRPPTSYTAVEVPGGSHTWGTYRKLMPDVFAWLTSVLDKPTPG